jgi:hypothetical protein
MVLPWQARRIVLPLAEVLWHSHHKISPRAGLHWNNVLCSVKSCQQLSDITVGGVAGHRGKHQFNDAANPGRTCKGFAFLHNEERNCKARSGNIIIRAEMQLSNWMSEGSLVTQTLKKLIIARMSLYLIPFVSYSTQVIRIFQSSIK